MNWLASDNSVQVLQQNLRHLRVFLAVVETGSATRAAELCHVSQPAVTQALSKIERSIGISLFDRTTQGLFSNRAGQQLATRVRRAFGYLDPALTDLSPRLRITATSAQLQALVAVRESENFTLAARRLGLAQPTVHRAVSQLEQEAARPLFERTSYGMVATRAAQALAQAARLSFAELAQAEADLADLTRAEAGRIVIGSLPLSRSYMLPKTISCFRKLRPNLPIHIMEGRYADLLQGLRRGEIDFLIGALRDPVPIGDVEQEELFCDTVVIVAGLNHPLVGRSDIALDELAFYPWIVAQAGTPTRKHFNELFAPLGNRAPRSIVESGSLILMRELLDESDHLGCVSYLQAKAEIARGLMTALDIDLSHTSRPIGLTFRHGWMPTTAQQQFLDLLRDVRPRSDR
ncbi:LysR family transcriptional regulator [Rhizobium sp. LC145]|jgi:LysR family transcriptional regulator, regulator for genes of the gallate degradation pathway|uniref:LysR family transcriptional regulator n=1 Tax=Rhizobium sp. LC145 TaxID=1120688 RepID=UPI00062A3AB2|nr:LysR family transcriptional regulator [Rhizobium sp. LC145]KKX33121.1 LysR family transcriptional regulator [Rhizobium sp. LC145]TKT68719.1 LysR family transcriptional regulator [Rhizobiaceae bacterium LC148]